MVALDKENAEGQEINSLTSACGQITNQPTHITEESSPCVDLVFTTSPYSISKDVSIYHSLVSAVIASYMTY